MNGASFVQMTAMPGTRSFVDQPRTLTVMPVGSTAHIQRSHGNHIEVTPTVVAASRSIDAERALIEACRLLRVLGQLDNLPAETRVWFMGVQMREDDEVARVQRQAESGR